MPTITVKGMHCANCQKAVAEAITKVPGTIDVQVDLLKKEASWNDANPAVPASVDAIKNAIFTIGFDPE